MRLRDYQITCHDKVLEAWRSHVSALVVMPTGTGKTVLFAHVIKSRQPGRTMVLAHREELIWQARDKIVRATGLSCGVEMADMIAATNLFGRDEVVISTIQTQCSGGDKKRMERFDPFTFTTLIVDEGHHSPSPSYRSVLAWYRKNPELRVLGVTATPDRADQLALGEIFETVAFEYGMIDAINSGWLVNIAQHFAVVSGLDFSHLHTLAGDFNNGELKALMEIEENIQGVCQPTLEVMYGLDKDALAAMKPPEWGAYLRGLNVIPRRTIVFTASVAQAEACCNIFNRAVPGCAKWVCGETPKEKRRELLQEFATGKLSLVANCGVLTEGFDDPGVEIISMARPTKSRSLYAQMVGRATRPLPGLVDGLPTASERMAAIKASPKPFCRILDFVGNSGRHRLITCADILGGKSSPEAIQRAVEKTIAEGKPKLVLTTLSNAEKKIAEERQKAKEDAERQEEARKAALVAKSKFSMYEVDPFNGHGEKSSLSKDGHWQRPVSEKQKNVLRKAGYDPDKFHPNQIRAMVGRIIAGWNAKKDKAA
ncbi:MAG TPA: DEAD/DEAH box helicase [Nitrospiraceae bacterium]